METLLLYYREMRLPLGISKKMLDEHCDQKKITYDVSDAPRTYKFYGFSESDLRWLTVNLSLIPLTLEYETVESVVSK